MAQYNINGKTYDTMPVRYFYNPTDNFITVGASPNHLWGTREITQSEAKSLLKNDPKINISSLQGGGLNSEIAKNMIEDANYDTKMLASVPELGLSYTSVDTVQGAYKMANDPNLINVGTAEKPMYVPRGSAAAANQVNIGGTNAPITPTPQVLGNQSNNIKPPTVNLQPGMTGNDVKQLQDYLVSKGFMTQAEVDTGYGTYGPKTTEAVRKLQESLGVDNTTGVGYYGPRTIQAISGTTTTQPTTNNGPATAITEPTTNITTTDPTTSEPTTTEQSYTTGNESLDEILKSFQGTLEELLKQGTTINPKVEITPEILKQFTDQVSSELDPYYKSQFEAVKTDLQDDLGSLSEQYTQAAKEAEAQFKQSLATQRETEAGAGTIFSGGRTTREGAIKSSAERNLESLSTSLKSKVGDIGKIAERTIGSLGLSGVTSPTVSNYGVSTLGEGQYTPISTSQLYSSMGGITGTLEREQVEKKRSYLDLLKSNYLSEKNV